MTVVHKWTEALRETLTEPAVDYQIYVPTEQEVRNIIETSFKFICGCEPKDLGWFNKTPESINEIRELVVPSIVGSMIQEVIKDESLADDLTYAVNSIVDFVYQFDEKIRNDPKLAERSSGSQQEPSNFDIPEEAAADIKILMENMGTIESAHNSIRSFIDKYSSDQSATSIASMKQQAISTYDSTFKSFGEHFDGDKLQEQMVLYGGQLLNACYAALQSDT